MAGRPLKLSAEVLPELRQWYAQPTRVKEPRVKVMVYRYGCCRETLLKAIRGKEGYSDRL